MELKFKVPKFRPGLNVTFRKASPKYLEAEKGVALDLLETDGPKVGTGMLIETIPLHWRTDQQIIGGLCMFEHDPDCHDINGLAQAMNHAYGVNSWGPEVVALLFLVGDDVETESLGDQEITFGEPVVAKMSQAPVPALDSPPIEEPAPTEAQEAPVPRADLAGSPIVKVHKDENGVSWAYRVTESGLLGLKAENEDDWLLAARDEWPDELIRAVEPLEG